MHRLPVRVLFAIALSAVQPGCSGRVDRPSAPPAAPATQARAGGRTAAARVRERLAARLHIAPEALRLVTEEAVRWSDSALGCPAPGTLSMQVITPGWRLRFEGPGGTPYEVHTNRDGSAWVLCPHAGHAVVPEHQ